jgi:hypothetical protein
LAATEVTFLLTNETDAISPVIVDEFVVAAVMVVIEFCELSVEVDVFSVAEVSVNVTKELSFDPSPTAAIWSVLFMASVEILA